MTILKVYSSLTDGNDRRSDFIEFYDDAYSTIVGELLALTGCLDHARAVGAGSFSRAWQAWPSIRMLAEPEMWVREDAMTRAYAPPRGMRLLQRGLPPIEPVEFDPEDDVLVTALQRLPMEQRLPLVLHYLGDVPTMLIAEWARRAPDQIEAVLDDAFDALVAHLDWSFDESDEEYSADAEYSADEKYDWTAEALQDSARRLPQHITTPPPTVAFRHAAAVKLSKRSAPVSAAAAACLGLALTLSIPDQQPSTRPAAFNRAPDQDQAPRPTLGPTLATPPSDNSAAEITTSSPVPPPVPPKPRPRPALKARSLAAATSSPVHAAATVTQATSNTPAPTTTTATPTTTTATPTPTPTPITTVTMTAAAAPPASSSSPAGTTEASETTTTEVSGVETTRPRHRPSPRPRPDVTTTAEATPTGDETLTTVLPVTTSASDDG